MSETTRHLSRFLSAEVLLQHLRSLDIQLSVSAGKDLRFSAPEGVFTDELKEAVRLHKADLIQLLSDQPSTAAVPFGTGSRAATAANQTERQHVSLQTPQCDLSQVQLHVSQRDFPAGWTGIDIVGELPNELLSQALQQAGHAGIDTCLNIAAMAGGAREDILQRFIQTSLTDSSKVLLIRLSESVQLLLLSSAGASAEHLVNTLSQWLGGNVPASAPGWECEFAIHPAIEGQWLARRDAPGSQTYTVSFVIPLATLGVADWSLASPAQRQLVEQALGFVFERHQALRSSFIERDGQVLQRVWPVARLLQQDANRIREVAEIVELAEPVFDLGVPPLIRFGMNSGQPDLLLVVADHLMFDGWSIGILKTELTALLNNQPLPEAGSLQQLSGNARQALSGETGRVLQQYWLSAMKTVSTPLFSDPDLVTGQAAVGRRRLLVLPESTLSALRQLTRVGEGGTLAMVWNAVVVAALSRYKDSDSGVTLGQPFSGRTAREQQGVIGCFVNVLPLRLAHPGEWPFAQLLSEVRRCMSGALNHQQYPLAQLMMALATEQGGQQGQNVFDCVAQVEEAEAIPKDADEQFGAGKFPLMLGLLRYREQGQERATIAAEFDCRRYGEAWVQRLLEQLCCLIEAVAAAPEQKLASLNALPLTQLQQLQQFASLSSRLYPREQGLASLLHQAMERWPRRAALSDAGHSLSFAELQQQVECVAALLQQRGVQAGDVVALAMARTPQAVVAILAINWIGAVYLPLDKAMSATAALPLLQQAECRLLLVDESRVAAMTELAEQLQLLLVNAQSLTRSAEPVKPVHRHGEDAAYILFTSGSTGEPKGVVVPQRAVARLVMNTDLPGISEADFADGEAMAQAGSLGFDAATLEIWGALLNGGRVHVLDDETLFDPTAFGACLSRHNIRVMWLTASLFNRMADEQPEVFRPLRVLMTGGETLSPEHVRKVMQACPALQLLNGYGPTENTTFTTVWPISPADLQAHDIPIGRPVARSSVYVLDEAQQPVAVGVWGELYSGGDGLALGYNGRDDLTAAAFVYVAGLNPSSPMQTERFYRTGDQVRWDSEGRLHFGGRRDGQVKIRGHRIELSAIEAQLAALDDIGDAMVLPSSDLASDSGGRSLLAVCTLSQAVDEEQLAARCQQWRTRLSRQLPDYMVPERFYLATALPLNRNGKKDRRHVQAALQTGEYKAIQHSIEVGACAQSQTEDPALAMVISCFARIFPEDVITAQSDFFQLGGHSLLAMRLAAELESASSIRPRLGDLLDDRTVAAMADRLRPLLHDTRVQQQLIPRATGEDFPLSSGQLRLWLLQRMAPDSAVYSIPATLELRGSLNADALEQALLMLEQRQHALRLRPRRSERDADGVRQYLAEAGGLRPQRLALTEDQARARLADESVRPFQLEQEAPVRALLIQLSAERHWLHLNFHHSVCDGWSVAILLRELLACYQAALTGQAPELPALPRHYEDFASWQRQWLRSDEGQACRERWRERLTPQPEPLNLPLDRQRPLQRRFRGAFMDWQCPPALSAALQAKAEQAGSTPFSLLAAIMQVLLYRHTQQTDLALGMLVAGRDRAELAEQVGFFVNTLVLRQQLQPQQSFDSHWQQTRDTILQAIADQQLPFEEMVRVAGAGRDQQRNPLFDVLLAWQEGTPTLPALPGLQLELVETHFPFAKFDLAFYFWQSQQHGGLCGQVEFDTDLFDPATIELLLARLTCLAEAVVAEQHPDSLSQLPVIPAAEQALLSRFNATETALPTELTLAQLLQQQVMSTPEQLAVVGEQGQRLSFSEFAARALGVAQQLQRAGVEPGQTVALCISRSADMLVAIHGILLAGACYSPLDPQHPLQRRADMLEDLSVAGTQTLVLTSQTHQALFADHAVTTLLVEQMGPADWPDVTLPEDARQLAYVLFTSGSTGRPKAAAIEQHSVVNRILWMQSQFPLGAGDVILQKTPITFDVSVWELFWWSWTGAAVALLPVDGEKDPQQLALAIEQQQVTVMHFVPSMLASFLTALEDGKIAVERLRSLKYVFASGEALDLALVERFNRLLHESVGAELHNLYGPTEATVDVTWQPCSPWQGGDSVPIGKPIANTRVLILDNQQQPLPIGVAGELILAGPQVARGYLNRPELTAERFPADPQVAAGRWYRTGDLGRWRRDGSIDYLGRIDHQVKVRGFRIECGEIEAVLEAHPLVERALVVPAQVAGLTELHAYILPASANTSVATDNVLTSAELRQCLRLQVPEYMLPARFFQLAHLPMTSSGKVDRKALAGTPLDQRAPADASASQPQSDTVAGLEQELLALWQAILPEAHFSKDDGFFDAGGNSLLLLRLYDRLQQRWPDLFTVADLFSHSTVAAQARWLVGEGAQATVVSSTPAQLAPNEPIAIIGMAVQVADAETPQQLWQLLAEGADQVRPLPAAREQLARELSQALGRTAPRQFRQAAYRDELYGFEPRRFRMAPADAALIDPEQRLFLETAQMALEDAGYGGQALRGDAVGVFVGGGSNMLHRLALEQADLQRAEQIFALNVPSNIATRLSFLNDWHGPAALLDTACSSSLVAVHQACTELRNGHCQVALAGAAKLIPLPSDAAAGFTIDSSTARTRAFAEGADGTGMGEGSVVFLLKTLSAAEADGDAIHAVIRGSAVNQDGASSSAAAPNPLAQARVIQAAATAAQLPLHSLSYIEAHGTGTALGDPIEISGLTQAFAASESCSIAEQPKALIGSVKGNFGHLDHAAGGLGLLKAVLCLQYDQAPPQPFFTKPNPAIDFAQAPVQVAAQLQPLPVRGNPRRAGVSSFGLSGINAHIMVEAAPAATAQTTQMALPQGWSIVALSAGSKAALLSYAQALLGWLAEREAGQAGAHLLPNMAMTLCRGRAVMSWRFAVAVSDRQQLMLALMQLLAGDDRAVAEVAARRAASSPVLAPAAAWHGEQADAEAACQGWLSGGELVWPEHLPARRCHLPFVPFSRQQCKPALAKGTPSLHQPWFSGPTATADAQVFTLQLQDPACWPAAEHRLNGKATLVGMALPGLVAEAVRKLGQSPEGLTLTGLRWLRPLQAGQGQVSLLLHDDGRLQLGQRNSHGRWLVSAEGQWSVQPAVSEQWDLTALRERFSQHQPIPSFSTDHGILQVSERWDCHRAFWADPRSGEGLALLGLAHGYEADLQQLALHPALLDVAASLGITQGNSVLSGCESLQLLSVLPAEVLAIGRRHSAEPGALVDISLINPSSGELCLRMGGLRFAQLGQAEEALPAILLPRWQAMEQTVDLHWPAGTLLITDEHSIEVWPFVRYLPAQVKRCALNSLSRDDVHQAQHVLLALSADRQLAERTGQALQTLLRGVRQPCRVLVLGSGAYRLDDHDPLDVQPDAALAAGVCLAAGKEEALLEVGYLDIAAEEAVIGAAALLNQSDRLADISLWRCGQVYRRDVQAAEAPATGVSARNWPEQGVCVVSGGLGGFALALAPAFSAQGKVKLALLSRRSEAELEPQAQAQLAALRQQGVSVQLYRCDVSDYQQLADTLQQIRSQLGAITAVVHTAGAADGGFLAKRSLASFAPVLAAKVDGARHLDALTRDDPLTAFVLFGSLTAVLGAPGQSAYAAANAWLDSFAVWRRAAGKPALSIDWCALAEQGMAARFNVPLQKGAFITPAQAPILWQRALAVGQPQVVVLDPALLTQAQPQSHAQPVPSSVAKAAAIPEADVVQTAIAAVAPVTVDISQTLCAIFAEVLGYEQIGIDDDFYALGGDSITGMQIVERVSRQTGLQLSLADLLELASVQAIVASLPAVSIASEPLPLSTQPATLAVQPERLAQTESSPTDLTTTFSAIFAEVLGYEQVSADDDFYALGGDSITGMQIVEKISQRTGQQLSLADLLELATVGALVQKLAGDTEGSDSRAPADSADADDSKQTTTTDLSEGERFAGCYPLSWDQLAVLHAEQAGDMGTAFNLPHVISLSDEVELDRLQCAIVQLTARQPLLRTCMVSAQAEVQRDDGHGGAGRGQPQADVAAAELPHASPSALQSEWLQQVLPLSAAMPQLSVEQVADEQALQQRIRALLQPFDLLQGVPVRWKVLEDGQQRVLFFDIHHSLADGSSIEMLLAELGALYQGQALPAPRGYLHDYALQCQRELEQGVDRLQQSRDYWLGQYQGPLPLLDLPADRRRPPQHSYHGGMSGFNLPPELVREARTFAAQQRVTMFSLVLSAWALLLQRLAGVQEVVMAVPVDSRDANGFIGVPGMMVSLLPLRLQVATQPRVSELLAHVHQQHRQAMRHRAYSLGQLLEELAPPAAPERTLLSEVSLSYMNFASAGQLSGQAQEGQTPAFQVRGLERRHCKNDLSIFVRDQAEGISVVLDYYADLFDEERMQRLGEQFCEVLRQMVGHGDAPLSGLPLLPAAERQLLADFEQGEQPPLPLGQGLFRLFAQAAAQHGTELAVSDEHLSLTYAELQQQVLLLAATLQSEGVQPGDWVALHCQRGVPAIVAVLAIVALGAAYVPLDPAFPAARNRLILQDSGCRVALVDQQGAEALADQPVTLLCMTSAGKEELGLVTGQLLRIESGTASALLPATELRLPQPDDVDNLPVYLMYTSGSTGVPKGVVITQQAVVRLLHGGEALQPRAGERVGQAGPLAFDASTFEIWNTLLRGAHLCIIDYPLLLDPGILGQALQHWQIERMFMTVSLFNRQVDHDPASFRTLRTLLVGGEALSLPHIRRLLLACPQVQCWNGYGPTECTTFATLYPITRQQLAGQEGGVPIGRPLAHTQAVILDGLGQRAAIGVWGELYLGGLGLAREYWQQPERTVERFVSDPEQPSQRLYRTGDRARWRSDGQIEFGGRNDSQIKLRGLRIELEEIEQVLADAPGVASVAVLCHEQSLLAFITPSEQAQPLQAASLRAWLGQRLPAFMLPSRWWQLSALPLTASGKTDSRTLLSWLEQPERLTELPLGSQRAGVDGQSEMRLSDAERLVAEVFSEVFGQPVDDPATSFIDLGGHSLLAIRVVNRLAQRCGVRLPMAVFFADPSVAGLAHALESQAGVEQGSGQEGTEEVIPCVARAELYPASHAQRRLYLLQQMDPSGSAYNMMFAFNVSAELQPELLQQALQALAWRHEPLRTAFVEQDDGQIMQRITEAVPHVQLDDVSHHPAARAEALRLARQEAATGFDLTKPPLIRARVIRVSASEALMLVVLHHIVGDGWSSRILVRELGELYRAAQSRSEPQLPPLPIHYKDYAAWQASRQWQQAAEYWGEALRGAPEQIALPTDRPAPAVQSFRGACVQTLLPQGVASGLRLMAERLQVSVSAVGMALFASVLYRLTRQDDLVIGMGVAGRDRLETEGLIGFFVNVLPIRLQLTADTELEPLIVAARQRMVEALDQRDYPFDELVRGLGRQRQSNRQPLVNVVFEYQQFGALAADNVAGLPLLPAGQPGMLEEDIRQILAQTTAKHDLLLFYAEEPQADGCDQVRLTLEYDTDLFDAATAERWLSFYVRFAGAAAAHEMTQRQDGQA